MTYVFGPTWFYGIDYIFDLVSVIVGLLICYFSYKAYRYTSQKKYFYFSASFFLVASAFISKILATIPIYSKELKVETVGLVTVTSHVINKVKWINALGISVARLVMLFAFLILVLVSLKIKDKKIIALLVYLVVISTTLVSQSYIVFHVTLLLMMGMLYLSYRKNYKKVKRLNARIVMYSFLALLVSQIFFIFEGMVNYFYVIGESIQLIGYLTLLAAMINMMVKK
ncbi:hypothetical protein KY358_00160 [Candidatus Woesearchaeota archaeon]|nr:hypothetical protein [Candidatus Woesearchaeota archaeon]